MFEKVIFAHKNLMSTNTDEAINHVHAKSTGELISVGFSDRSVRPLVSANHSANRLAIRCMSPNEKRLHFLADLWSQSEFRTQRKCQRKTDPKSEMTDWSFISLFGFR